MDDPSTRALKTRRNGFLVVSSSLGKQDCHFQLEGGQSTNSPPSGRRRIFPRSHSQHDGGSGSPVDI